MERDGKRDGKVATLIDHDGGTESFLRVQIAPASGAIHSSFGMRMKGNSVLLPSL